jgi:CBS domain containing-hemolysin-like protein
MTLLLLLSGIILLLSFMASSMEAALFSVTPVQIEKLCSEKRPGAQQLKSNKDRIQDSIIAIVFLNNIANVAGSIVVGSVAAAVLNDIWIGVYSGAFTLTIIFLGEITPKVVGERFAIGYGRATAGLVRFLRIIFLPFVAVTRFITRPFGTAGENAGVSEEEITLLAHLGHRHGAIQESENLLIRNVFQLNDTAARDIMTPRTVVFALQVDRTLAAVADELYRAHVSRIPVYGEDLDDITGIVHIRELLAALAQGQGERRIGDFAKDVAFIPDTARADVLLASFQKDRAHLAVVIDEYGGTAGILTLEDILEQLVGEIVDEFDRDVDMRARARSLREKRRNLPRT